MNEPIKNIKPLSSDLDPAAWAKVAARLGATPVEFDTEFVSPTRAEIRAGKKSDPKFLQSITEKEFKVMAILEILEDTIWIDGVETQLNGEKVVMHGDTYGRSIEDRIQAWKSYFSEVEKEDYWKDGKHDGDCTKVASTCFRCMCESHLKSTRRFIKFFNGPYNDETY